MNAVCVIVAWGKLTDLNKAGVFRSIIPISKPQNWQAHEFEQTYSFIKTPAVATTGDSWVCFLS